MSNSCRLDIFAKAIKSISCEVLILVLISGTAPAWQAVPGLSNKHPLAQAKAGDVLISEFRCSACHGGIEKSQVEKLAPDLSQAGSRISADYLKRYLASPLSAHPGTKMPDVLTSRSNAEREKIAEALTHFLIAQSNQIAQVDEPAQADLPDGKALYHSVGCVVCHGPREKLGDEFLFQMPIVVLDEEDEDTNQPNEQESPAPVVVNLAHVATKYHANSLSQFLFQPLKVRSSGRMPDMKLTQAESQAIAKYLIGEQPEESKPLLPVETLVTAGKKYFQQLNCAACHPLGGIPAAAPSRSLRDANLTHGCLSKTSGKHPTFNLDDVQIQAITASLKDDSKPDTDAVMLAKTLTTFNCLACHIRDEYGGVIEDFAPYFLTSEKNLGEDARIPPPLTLVGAKLQPTWLKKVLFDGESVRPYMATRMPKFGTANLHHLPDLVARLDHLQSKEMDIPGSEHRNEKEREREKLLRAAGRELLGDKGLNCINCHNFNGKPAPVNKGIDLMTSYQRLQPGWFNAFLRNPGGFRPRILMPTAWSNGVASHKTILDGNTDMQIEAIWYYLSLGTSAADPPGIRWSNTKLAVGDEARTYRGRSRVAGFRGIAVGLPKGLSYAFNAETGTLSAIWQGDFISVNWNGQGSGDFNPASEPILLAQDVSFARLPDENSPWPLLPVMTKEARVNPNAMYPKNIGYQFRGYFLDETLVPTFMYSSGTIQIEDRSGATRTDEVLVLTRVLQFNSPSPQTVWFRALTGDISSESDRVFRSGRLRLTIPAVKATVRSLSDEPTSSELLLSLQIPQGKSSIELRYEPLSK